jgi:hypothetical protein
MILIEREIVTLQSSMQTGRTLSRSPKVAIFCDRLLGVTPAGASFRGKGVMADDREAWHATSKEAASYLALGNHPVVGGSRCRVANRLKRTEEANVDPPG